MKGKKDDSAIKAMKRAEREIELDRNGRAHPWVAKDVAHRNKRKYRRADNKKEQLQSAQYML